MLHGQRHRVRRRGAVSRSQHITALSLACLGLLLTAGGCSPVGSVTGAAPAGTSVDIAPTETSTAPPEQSAEETPSSPAPTPGAPRVIGRSVQGRTIMTRTFGSGKRKVLVLGGVHGNEYGTHVAEEFAARLLAEPSDVPPDVEIHVIGCLNPDGHAAGSRGNANKVDLNLNLPTENWVHDLHPATSAAQHDLNGGVTPGSEPETQALISYLGTGDFDLIISLHSAGGVIDWDGPGAEKIAREMSRISGMPAQHLAVQPYATGTLGQYAPEVLGVPVITIELESNRLNGQLLEALLTATRGS